MGPFNLTVSDASIDVFMNPPGSTAAMNFSGTISMGIGFPLLGTNVALAARLDYPMSASAPLVVNMTMPATASTYGFGFAGAFQFYGLYNSQNMGLLALQIPGLAEFSTTTDMP